ncbi:MAG: tetratricopeptide repeat protein [Myxococcota bacterium]
MDSNASPQAEEHTSFCAQYIKENKLVEADARCKLAREFSPKYAEPVNLLGVIQYHRGNLDRAMELYKEALSLKNDFAEAHSNLGVIFFERRNYEAACDEFRQAIEIDPGYVDARVNLATCHRLEGRKTEARNEYLKCVESDPTFCDCRMGLGVLSLDAEEWDEASIHFKRLTEICPMQAEGHYNYCYALVKQGRCGDAVDACIGALAIKPDYIEARTNLTVAYECLALQDEALETFIKELSKNPGDPHLHYQAGAAYDEKKLYDRALSEYMNAIKLDPKHKLAHYRAARVLDRLLRSQETVDMCKDFVNLTRSDELRDERDWCIQRVQELQFQNLP